jgi:hypothetical protein
MFENTSVEYELHSPLANELNKIIDYANLERIILSDKLFNYLNDAISKLECNYRKENNLN